MIRIVLFILCLFLACGHCLAGELTAQQERVLGYAYCYGEAGGEGLGTAVQGIVWQETQAGRFKGMKNPHHDDPDIERRYFGVGQIKLCALRDVEKAYGLEFGGTKEERARMLRDEDAFNVAVMALYLRYLYRYFDGDVDRAILAYNVGMGNVRKHGLSHDPYGYLAGVKSHMAGVVAEYNTDKPFVRERGRAWPE